MREDPCRCEEHQVSRSLLRHTGWEDWGLQLSAFLGLSGRQPGYFPHLLVCAVLTFPLMRVSIFPHYLAGWIWLKMPQWEVLQMNRFHKNPLTLKWLSISEVLLLASFRVTTLFMVHAVFSFTAGWFCGKSTQGVWRLLKALPFSFSRNTKCDTFSAIASVVLNRENNTLPLRSIKGLWSSYLRSAFSFQEKVL